MNNKIIEDAIQNNPISFYNDCDEQKRNELIDYNSLKYNFSVSTTKLLMILSKDEKEYLKNVDASNSLTELLKEKRNKEMMSQ